MASRFSTGLRNEMLKKGGSSLADAMANGIIRIYSGSQPASADDAETGTLLVEITLDGNAFTPGQPDNGINLNTAADGTVSKDSGETWKGTGVADGTAGWFRYFDNSVTTGASSAAKRFDGACGTSGAELNLSSTAITNGGSVTIDSFQVTLPES